MSRAVPPPSSPRPARTFTNKRLLPALLLCAAGAAAQGPRGDPARELRELQPKIDAAIDRGVEFLLRRQQRDGTWSGDEHRFPLGQTALCVYTLLKSHVPPEHPSIRRALAYLKPRRAQETYSAACVLMALDATKDPVWKDKVRETAEDLMRWQVRGIWSYPKAWTDVVWPDEPGAPDLSNTQFAALGLRAAARAGVKIRPEVWIGLAEATFPWQEEKPQDVEIDEGGYRRTVPAAGFRYRNDRNASAKFTRAPTASMTCAGVCTLAIVREQLGAKASSGFVEKLKTSNERALAWLAAHWSVADNPGEGENWWIYYLYGLERVGAFLQLEEIGGRRWYLEGAKALLAKQGGAGDWPTAYHPRADTCFALLFLERATAGTTGGSGRKRPTKVSEGKDAAVRFRAQGGVDGTPFALFVTGFGEAALAAHAGADGAPVRGLRVARVEWLVNGEIVATVAGAPDRGWRTEPFAATYAPRARGAHRIGVRAHVVAADAPPDAKETTIVLEGEAVDVDCDYVHEPWMDRAATAGLRNRVAPTNVRASASSAQNDGRAPDRAFDGRQNTGWFFVPGDATPTLTATFVEPVRADTLVLSQAHGQLHDRDGHDVALKVRVAVNGQKPVEFALSPDETVPTEIPLGAPLGVRKIEIAIVERRKGKSWPGFGGFAEVGLELSTAKSP